MISISAKYSEMEASHGPPRVKDKGASTQKIRYVSTLWAVFPCNHKTNKPRSAEQIFREAFEWQEQGLQAPTQISADLEELHEFQDRKRKEFEDYVGRNRINMNNWMRDAQWELDQKEYARARSTLEVDSRSVVLWLRYIEAEMKTRSINHARNLLETHKHRAITILPRVDKL